MATYKPYRKTASGKEEVKVPSSAVSGLATVATSGSYNDLSDKPSIPSAVTSIDGLAGGELTSPLVVSGGDGATAHKIALNQAGNGQITDNGTGTIFGFMNSSQLTVGGNSYSLNLRGNGTRPTYKGADMALKSDVPDVSKMVTTDGAQDIYGVKRFANGIELGDGNKLVGASDVSNITNILPGKDGYLAAQSDVDKKANLDGGNTFSGGQDFVLPYGQYFYVSDKYDMTLFDVSADGVDIDPESVGTVPLMIGSSTGTDGQVLTSQGAGKTPIWKDAPSGGATDAVKYTAQTLTTSQKAQARTNIGAGTGYGTVTGVKLNGAIQGTSGVVDLGYNKVKVNGTTYTADSSGLIDLGTISGSTTTYAKIYNNIY